MQQINHFILRQIKISKYNIMPKTRKTRKIHPLIHNNFYSLEKRFFKVNNKVFENTTTETKNNIMRKRGYLYGKKINQSKKLKQI